MADEKPGLPKLPSHPESQVMDWSALEEEALARYGESCYDAAIAECARLGWKGPAFKQDLTTVHPDAERVAPTWADAVAEQQRAIEANNPERAEHVVHSQAPCDHPCGRMVCAVGCVRAKDYPGDLADTSIVGGLAAPAHSQAGDVGATLDTCPCGTFGRVKTSPLAAGAFEGLAAAFERAANWLTKGVLEGPTLTHPMVGPREFQQAAEILRALPPAAGRVAELHEKALRLTRTLETIQQQRDAALAQLASCRQRIVDLEDVVKCQRENDVDTAAQLAEARRDRDLEKKIRKDYVDRVAELEERLAEARVDAERYRWLRDQVHGFHVDHTEEQEIGNYIEVRIYCTSDRSDWRKPMAECVDDGCDAARTKAEGAEHG